MLLCVCVCACVRACMRVCVHAYARVCTLGLKQIIQIVGSCFKSQLPSSIFCIRNVQYELVHYMMLYNNVFWYFLYYTTLINTGSNDMFLISMKHTDSQVPTQGYRIFYCLINI